MAAALETAEGFLINAADAAGGTFPTNSGPWLLQRIDVFIPAASAPATTTRFTLVINGHDATPLNIGGPSSSGVNFHASVDFPCPLNINEGGVYASLLPTGGLVSLWKA